MEMSGTVEKIEAQAKSDFLIQKTHSCLHMRLLDSYFMCGGEMEKKCSQLACILVLLYCLPS